MIHTLVDRLLGAALEGCLETSIDTECVPIGVPWSEHIIPVLLSAVDSSLFWVQFRALVTTYIALTWLGTRASECLSLPAWSYPHTVFFWDDVLCSTTYRYICRYAGQVSAAATAGWSNRSFYRLRDSWMSTLPMTLKASSSNQGTGVRMIITQIGQCNDDVFDSHCSTPVPACSACQHLGKLFSLFRVASLMWSSLNVLGRLG